uniref:Uncharacterized protein n=1 Tax=Magallana gigas TaxID=29159 RepID=K1PLV5_MAGGI
MLPKYHLPHPHQSFQITQLSRSSTQILTGKVHLRITMLTVRQLTWSVGGGEVRALYQTHTTTTDPQSGSGLPLEDDSENFSSQGRPGALDVSGPDD